MRCVLVLDGGPADGVELENDDGDDFPDEVGIEVKASGRVAVYVARRGGIGKRLGEVMRYYDFERWR